MQLSRHGAQLVDAVPFDVLLVHRKDCSRVQVEEQPSLLLVFPSSQA
jgi:hypothetical protein